MGKNIKMEGMTWRVHTPNLLKEIADCAIIQTAGVLKFPMNEFRRLLIEVAERASQLNDDKLNALMCRLTLYEIADPETKDYDYDLVQELIKKGED